MLGWVSDGVWTRNLQFKSNNITQWATLLKKSSFWIYFYFLSDPSNCSMVVFLPLENSDHVFAWVFIDFSLNLLGKEFVTDFDCSLADCDDFCYHLRDVWMEYIFDANFSSRVYPSYFLHYWHRANIPPHALVTMSQRSKTSNGNSKAKSSCDHKCYLELRLVLSK